ncbi:hypothetical protein QTN25_009951 [Entamoeba marina]
MSDSSLIPPPTPPRSYANRSNSRSSLSPRSDEITPNSLPQPDKVLSPNHDTSTVVHKKGHSLSVSTTVDSSNQPQKQPTKLQTQEVTFKYVANPSGTLITSGDIIQVHLKKFRNDSITSDKKETDEEFFTRIETREMTEKDKSHYRRVVNEYEQTERAHIRGLDIMKNVYLIPITKCVSKQDELFMRDVLTQVDIIIQVHQNFLEMFENGLKDSKEGELPILGKGVHWKSSIFENGITIYWKL